MRHKHFVGGLVANFHKLFMLVRVFQRDRGVTGKLDQRFLVFVGELTVAFVNQLKRAYHALKNNPASRQVVIQIWDVKSDFPNGSGTPASPDIPCNLFSMLKVRNGKLEWTQVMRSNDLYRGTPYNFVQFTTLQEILAGWLGMDVGGYYQISDSLHIYENDCQELSIRSDSNVFFNNDNLAIDKEAFDNVFNIIWKKMVNLTQPNLTDEEFYQVIEIDNMPVGYRNLLLTAAADSARRNGNIKGMNSAIEACSNPVLTALTQSWVERWQK